MVDVLDVEAAKVAARQSVGAEPVRVVAIPVGAFGWRFGWTEDDEDPDVDVLEFEALDHVPALVAAIEEAAPKCTAEADGPSGVVRCELDAHGSEGHRSGDLIW